MVDNSEIQDTIASTNRAILVYYSQVEVGLTALLVLTIFFSLGGIWVLVFFAFFSLPYLELVWVFFRSSKIDKTYDDKIRRKLEIPKNTILRESPDSENYAREVLGGSIVVLSSDVLSDLDSNWHVVAHEIGHISGLDRSLEIYLNIIYAIIHLYSGLLCFAFGLELFYVWFFNESSFFFSGKENEYFFSFIAFVIFVTFGFITYAWRRTVVLRRENVADLYAYSHFGSQVVEWLRDQRLLESSITNKLEIGEFGPTHPNRSQRIEVLTNRLKNPSLRLRFFSFLISILSVIFYFTYFSKIADVKASNLQESIVLGSYAIYFFLSGILSPAVVLPGVKKVKLFIFFNIMIGCLAGAVFISLFYLCTMLSNDFNLLPIRLNTSSIAAAITLQISLIALGIVNGILFIFDIERKYTIGLISIIGLMAVMPLGVFLHYVSDNFQLFFGYEGVLIIIAYSFIAIAVSYKFHILNSDIYVPKTL